MTANMMSKVNIATPLETANAPSPRGNARESPIATKSFQLVILRGRNDAFLWNRFERGGRYIAMIRVRDVVERILKRVTTSKQCLELRPKHHENCRRLNDSLSKDSWPVPTSSLQLFPGIFEGFTKRTNTTS